MKKLLRCSMGILLTCMLFTGCTKNISEGGKHEDDKSLSMCFVNSGKSDSIIVKYEGKSYLIDTGTKDSAEVIEKCLELNNVDNLQGVFLTHTHKDHIGGLKKLSKKYDIPIVYSAEISMNEDDGTNAIDTLVNDKLSLNHKKLKFGDKVNITDDVYFEVLGPITYNSDDDNNNSLVLRLSVYGKTILFAGDMKHEEEETLMNAGTNLKADILKVAHHGRKDATSKEFAEAVSPEIAVITTDRQEDSRTASDNVLKILKSAKVYITDEYDDGVLVTINEQGEITVR